MGVGEVEEWEKKGNEEGGGKERPPLMVGL